MENPFKASQARCEQVYQNKGITYEIISLMAEFETDPEFLKSILPPCFSVPDAPIGRFVINKARTHDIQVGEKGHLFSDMSILAFDCKAEGLEGPIEYSPIAYFDDEQVIYSGREFLGEPKRYGKTELFVLNNRASAVLERFGLPIAEMVVELREDEGPQEPVSNFAGHLKCCLTHQQNEMMYDPIAVFSRREQKHLVKRSGSGVLRLLGGPKDALDEVPVLKILRFEYTESLTSYTNPVPAMTHPDRHAIMPYYLGTSQNYGR